MGVLANITTAFMGYTDGVSFGLWNNFFDFVAPGMRCALKERNPELYDGGSFTGTVAGFFIPVGGIFSAGLKAIQGARALFLAVDTLRAATLALRTKQLAVATEHLEGLGLAAVGQNAAMLSRISDALAAGRTLTAGQVNFLVHEVTEAETMITGVSQAESHSIAMLSHPTYMNYDPEVIVEFLGVAFNSNWLRAWGISG